MSKGIRISKEFGVNPSVLRCECCGKEYGLGLFGTAIKDKRTGKTCKAPSAMAHGLCGDCNKVISSGGLMVIEVRDGESQNSPQNPYRTGRLVGCSKEFRERNSIEQPVIYMEHTLFSQLFDDYLKSNGTDEAAEGNG